MSGMTSPAVEPSVFRDAMARFPSGVVIATARDEAGEAHGFTASSFCSVSADPPLVLVCLARSANCHPVFSRCRSFAISIVAADQVHHAVRFATKGARKFTDLDFTTTANGQPALSDALVTLNCAVAGRHPAGDHTIIVGHVQQIGLGVHDQPAVYYNRTFHTLVATDDASGTYAESAKRRR
jgi:flavin reductase ActVB